MLNSAKKVQDMFKKLISEEKEKLKGMDEKKKKTCDGIIHTASVAAGTAGAGIAQIPLADTVVITPIQIAMITALGKVFDQKISDSVAKGILSSMLASFGGRAASQLLWGWIPLLGNASNAATAVFLTELVGWMAVSSFYEKYDLQQNYENIKEEQELRLALGFEQNKSNSQEKP